MIRDFQYFLLAVPCAMLIMLIGVLMMIVANIAIATAPKWQRKKVTLPAWVYDMDRYDAKPQSATPRRAAPTSHYQQQQQRSGVKQQHLFQPQPQQQRQQQQQQPRRDQSGVHHDRDEVFYSSAPNIHHHQQRALAQPSRDQIGHVTSHHVTRTHDVYDRKDGASRTVDKSGETGQRRVYNPGPRPVVQVTRRADHGYEMEERGGAVQTSYRRDAAELPVKANFV